MALTSASAAQVGGLETKGMLCIQLRHLVTSEGNSELTMLIT